MGRGMPQAHSIHVDAVTKTSLMAELLTQSHGASLSADSVASCFTDEASKRFSRLQHLNMREGEKLVDPARITP